MKKIYTLELQFITEGRMCIEAESESRARELATILLDNGQGDITSEQGGANTIISIGELTSPDKADREQAESNTSEAVESED